MRISDWSSDVCSSDLAFDAAAFEGFKRRLVKGGHPLMSLVPFDDRDGWIWLDGRFVPWREATVHVLTHGLHYASAVFEGERMYGGERSEEHTSELQSLMRISYAVFCLKKNITTVIQTTILA